MTDIIRANPGFWLHWVPGKYDFKFERFCSPIIAWRKSGAGYRYNPLTIDGGLGNIDSRWDCAIEYPDGTCVDDGGTRHPDVAAWERASEASYHEHCEEPAASGECEGSVTQ